MAVDYGVEILVDASVTTSEKAKLVRKVIQVLESYTLSIAYVATYAAGAGSTNQATLTVGGAAPNLGIRITLDATAFGADKVPDVLRKILQVLEPETLTIAHAAAYAGGSRAYNVTIGVT